MSKEYGSKRSESAKESSCGSRKGIMKNNAKTESSKESGNGKSSESNKMTK